ncbi:MAG: hypothetical protein GDA52_10580 [Rhodobacteraceae bacterium]|nr:hypothetical protein [Paracoccaceae bacterium]
MEQHVSSEIGAMPFLWLGVDDVPEPDSDRDMIEGGVIALLVILANRQLIRHYQTGWDDTENI